MDPLLTKQSNSEEKNPEKEMMPLHWDNRIPRRGLGNLIYKANHIGLTVSDIGISTWFYSDILGLQQIRRPNFDRHGAWFTMGNIELHLILGKPVVPSGDDLIVGHISLESKNIKEVLQKLKEMKIPFQTNVSVNKAYDEEGAVTQYFFRDPDGYYIELCNCDILTEFCLGNEKLIMEGYNENGTQTVGLSVITKLIAKAMYAKSVLKTMEPDEDIMRSYESIDGSGNIVDETKLANLVKRTHIYGDVCQGETEDSFRVALMKFNNNVPDVIRYIEAKHGDDQEYTPPAVYQNDGEMYQPPTFHINK